MAVNPENYFTGDGSTTSYNLTFEYIDETDVKVTLDGVVTTAYSFANATTILFDTAPGNDVEIRIYRDTNVDELKSTFFAGSSIRAQDLNKNFEQNNFAVQEIKAYTWDNETDTIHSDETWVSSDTQIATTAAMDARFQDEATETITSAETWPDNDDTIATTAAIDNRIDTAITNDIGTDGTGITVTDDGDGTITLGLADNSIDFSKIKDADIITETEQDAGSPSPADTNLFTALGAARRFDTIVYPSEISSSEPWEIGKTWLQNDSEKTVRIWDGSAWVAVASGGAFTTLSKVVYVDSVNGDDDLEGHRISNPKRTIKAAIAQINAETDADGDGSVVIVAPGVYQEIAPIDIQKKNVSIIGQALRSCIVHPTPATEENTLFRLNSGSYIANLTLTGVKASGTRGGNSLDTDSTYGLPTNQGWNFAFYPGATIVKSPYIANCTNFSDSEIDNSDLDAFNPRGGIGGDDDSAPTGGGILIDGSVVSSSSPLRSMVCDSYTHVGLDGPGIFVTNNGYCQATSSYAFFTHYHIKTLNGGQANLAASTSDFGRYGLIASGKSSTNIFTAAAAAPIDDADPLLDRGIAGATKFTIGAPSAHSSWYGTATRPQSNMLVQIGGNANGTGGTIYPIISATANGSGWDVEISNPDPDNYSRNLGLASTVTSGTTIRFFLRSMIASSGHTMEYVGSGTDYSALPENGGLPVEANEIVELNDGKVWAATTNHQGKFTVGPTFNVDQVTGYVNIESGAIGIEKLIEDLDLNSYTLSDSTGDVTIDDQMDMNTHKIVNVVDPTSAQDAATKNYVDTSSANTNYVAVTGDTMSGDLNMGSNTVTGLGTPSAASDAATKAYVDVKLDKAGDTMTGDLTMNAQSDIRFADSDSSNWVAIQAPATIGTNYTLTLPNSTGNAGEALITDASGNLSWSSNISTVVDQLIEGDTKVEAVDTGSNGEIQFTTDGDRAMTIDSSQNVGIGTASPDAKLEVVENSTGSVEVARLRIEGQTNNPMLRIFADEANQTVTLDTSGSVAGTELVFKEGNSEAMRITSSGNVGIGTSSPGSILHAKGGSISTPSTVSAFIANATARLVVDHTNEYGAYIGYANGTTDAIAIQSTTAAGSVRPLGLNPYGGNVGIGTTSQVAADVKLEVKDGIFAVTNSSGGDARIFLGSSTSPGHSKGQIRYSLADESLEFYSNSSEQMRIDSSGNVGIGTSSPASDAQLTLDNGGSGDVAISLRRSGSAQGDVAITNTGSNLTFKTGSSDTVAGLTERVRIDGSGNVGIGTSSPSSKLHSVGTTILGTGTWPTSTVGLSGARTAILSSTENQILIIGNTNATVGADKGAEIYLGAKATTSTENLAFAKIGGFKSNATSGNNESYLAFSTSNSVGTSSEKLRIDSSGRVGIGTISPIAPLNVNSGAVDLNAAFVGTGSPYIQIDNGTKKYIAQVIGSDFRIQDQSASAERLRIDTSGRLLVGTSSATYTTTAVFEGNSASGTGQGQIYLNKGDTTVAADTSIGILRFGATGDRRGADIRGIGDSTWTAGTSHPTRLAFYTTPVSSTSPTERMRIASTGAIGLSGANYGNSGQVLTSNGSGSAPSWQDKATVSSAVNTNTGSSVEFTGLTNVSKIIINFNEVSATSASSIKVKLGNSTAYLSTNYLSTSVSAGGGTADNATDSFVIDSGGAASNMSGQMTLCKIYSSTTWTSTHSVRVNSSNTRDGAGIVNVTTANPVDRVKISIDSGTFDAGSVNIIYWT